MHINLHCRHHQLGNCDELVGAHCHHFLLVHDESVDAVDVLLPLALDVDGVDIDVRFVVLVVGLFALESSEVFASSSIFNSFLISLSNCSGSGNLFFLGVILMPDQISLRCSGGAALLEIAISNAPRRGGPSPFNINCSSTFALHIINFFNISRYKSSARRLKTDQERHASTYNTGLTGSMSSFIEESDTFNFLLERLSSESCNNDCDFIIKSSDEQDFAVHKVVLAAASPHFNALFNVDMREKLEKSVTFYEIDSATLNQIIHYSYTSKIHLDEENVQLLAMAAQYLQIDWILNQCIHFMMYILDTSNCLIIYNFAEFHSLNNLVEHCRNYVVLNFRAIVLNKVYLEMSYKQFRDVITRDELHIGPERKFYKIIIDWIQFKMDERRNHLMEFIPQISSQSPGSQFLLRFLMEEPLVKDYFKDDLQALQNQKVERNFTNLLFIPNKDLCQMYQFPRWEYIPIPSMPTRRSYTSAVFTKNKFYILGGLTYSNSTFGNFDDCSGVEVFDPLTNEWSSILSMITARHSFGACVVGDSIYVCGGERFNVAINRTEKYMLEIGHWHSQRQMNFMGCAKSVTLNNVIYCVGRTEASSFDPREGNWNHLSSPTSLLDGFAVIPDNNVYIYRIGLLNNEMYDIRNNSWKMLSVSPTYRMGYGAVKLGNHIYVFGGESEKDYCESTVDVYNTVNDNWNIHPSLKIDCVNASSAILSTESLPKVYAS